MKMFTPRIVAACTAALLLALAAPAAESLSVLLQKGIYAEETERDLDAAIKIYEQIAAEAASNRSLVAQAQYRLAVCYQKQGKKEQTIAAFSQLLTQFPSETALCQAARQALLEFGQPAPDSITIRKVAVPGGVVSVAADGRLVVHMRAKSYDTFISDVATGKSWAAIKGTKDSFPYNGAMLSRDGSEVVYDLSGSGLYVANIDGTNIRKIYAGREYKLWPIGWSRGQRLIVAFTRSNRAGIGDLDMQTGNITEILSRDRPGNFGYGSKSVSADGRYLAYRGSADGDTRSRLVVMDLESGRETTVVERGVVAVVGWSPGDAKLLFLSDRAGVNGLWATAVRNGGPSGEPELIKANVGDIKPLSVTSDGRVFYVETRSTDGVFIATAELQTGEVPVQPRRVSERFSGVQSHPVWSSDGKRLMIAVQGAQRRFVAISSGSEDDLDFPAAAAFAEFPIQKFAWSPSRGFLLVQAVSAALGTSGIHRFDLASGAMESLVLSENGRNWNAQPRLSPDSSAFYYARREFSGHNVWTDAIIRRDLQSGRQEIVYAPADKLQIWAPFDLSPDGTRLAVVHSDQFLKEDFVVSLEIVEVKTGAGRQLVQFNPRENITSVSWAPDGKRLVYTKQSIGDHGNPVGAAEIWAIEADSRRTVQLKLALPGMRNVVVHPDGRRIAFQSGSGGHRDVWVMEGLFPRVVAKVSR